MKEKFFAHLKEESSKKELAWQLFEQLGLPDLNHPAFHYIPLSSLYQLRFESDTVSQDLSPLLSLFPETDQFLVFIDGVFRLDLSKIAPPLMVFPLSEGLKKFHSLFSHRQEYLQKEKDPFVLLNAACYQEGAFLYVPPNTEIAKPVEILFLSTCDKISYPRLQSFIGRNSHISFIHRTQSLVEKTFINDFIDLDIEPRARVKYFSLSRLPKQCWRFSSLLGLLKRDSFFEALNLTTGSKVTRYNIDISLLEENSEASLEGIGLLDFPSQHHTYVTMNHKAPQCRSNQLFKDILREGSRSSFEGKIYVDPVAQKTEAYQLNQNLLLNKGCIANSKPNLEIFADDVKASHGATFSELSEEELFYMRARGLSQDISKALLLRGFCKEILEKFPTSHSLFHDISLCFEEYFSHVPSSSP